MRIGMYRRPMIFLCKNMRRITEKNMIRTTVARWHTESICAWNKIICDAIPRAWNNEEPRVGAFALQVAYAGDFRFRSLSIGANKFSDLDSVVKIQIHGDGQEREINLKEWVKVGLHLNYE